MKESAADTSVTFLIDYLPELSEPDQIQPENSSPGLWILRTFTEAYGAFSVSRIWKLFELK